MIEVLSVENMKKSERAVIEGGVPGYDLMERAGKAVFDAVDWKEPVAVVCGVGSNAGDGYVIARLLHEEGIGCAVFLLEERFSPDGKKAYDACRSSGVPILLWEGQDLSRYETVVDCIFGVGFRGELTGRALEAVRALNESGARVVSVDINSGLDAASGQAGSCVRSDLTAAIGSFKPGHFLGSAMDVMKRKIALNIGVPPVETPFFLIGKSDLTRLFARRPHNVHKGVFGYTALIGGSMRYSGAIRLCAAANAAMRAGVGVVRAAFPRSIYHEVAPSLLESTAFLLSDDDGEVRFDEKEWSELTLGVSTVAVGMGIGRGEGAGRGLAWLLTHFSGVVIVDADGLWHLSRLPSDTVRNASCTLLLTPHAGEFARLSGVDATTLASDPIGHARRYASAMHCALLLKGPTTVITDGETVYLSDSGCGGMATAGSGDVLSGVLAAVCAYEKDLLFGAAAGAYIAGLAGEEAQRAFGSVSMLSGDTASCLPRVLREIEESGLTT